MKVFEAPAFEVVHFGKMNVVTSSTCSTDCECVDCLPCEYGDDCKYYDTCPTYCVKNN